MTVRLETDLSGWNNWGGFRAALFLCASRQKKGRHKGRPVSVMPWGSIQAVITSVNDPMARGLRDNSKPLSCPCFALGKFALLS